MINVVGPLVLLEETRKVEMDLWVKTDGTIEFGVAVYSTDVPNVRLDPTFCYSEDISDGSIWVAPFAECREELKPVLADLGVSAELVSVALATWDEVYTALQKATLLALRCNRRG